MGSTVGSREGVLDGSAEGRGVGSKVGSLDGRVDGSGEGRGVGSALGSREGRTVGSGDGMRDGKVEGTGEGAGDHWIQEIVPSGNVDLLKPLAPSQVQSEEPGLDTEFTSNELQAVQVFAPRRLRVFAGQGVHWKAEPP